MIMISLLLALAGAEAPATSAADPSRQMVCRREQLTGTRFARKICITRKAREEAAEADIKAMSEMRQNLVVRCTPGETC